LQRKLVDFLTGLPNLSDSATQHALLNSTGFDQQLQARLSVGLPVVQFIETLMPMLNQYSRMQDGRLALVAVLEAAQHFVGQNKQLLCNTLIEAVRKGSLL
jgi:hypothetical protein